MKYPLISAGQFKFEDSPINKGLIGGKIIATNLETGEQFFKIYKKYHNGKTDKFDVLAQLMYELQPPKEETENGNDTQESIKDGNSST